LRLWIASTDYSGEMTCSEAIIQRTGDSYRRIRNTARFMLANMAGFDPAQHCVPMQDLLALDRWLVHRAARLQEEVKVAYDNYQFLQVYQKVHHFCVMELGGFYLDIIKDRQYTTQADALARRSAQTALYHVLEAMVRWIAPIVSFTAEEIWAHMPGERTPSVLLSVWYDQLETLPDDAALSDAFWDQLIAVKEATNQALERLREEGLKGGSLAAEDTLYVEESRMALLRQLGDELRFVLITSAAELQPLSAAPADAVATEDEGIRILARASTAPKCVRCWHHRADVGRVAEHPELCGRCVENVTGSGEIRLYA